MVSPHRHLWCLQVYRYADAQITHTTYPDGLEVIQFPNKQTEKYHHDGSEEILFPDGTWRRLSDGREEMVFPYRTAVSVERSNHCVHNGQREIQTSCFKRREYPDGTVKTVCCTGHQETQYASGRVEFRYEPGNTVLDRRRGRPSTPDVPCDFQLQGFLVKQDKRLEQH
uniref:Centromere protein J C-terminal domain-containing protein n=1 Tax=Suricata suricatta TaxID=37032 RepID=A0A673UA58_SURSU